MRESARPLLTPTQWLVLERLAAGEDNAAIGQALGIRPGTVASHIKAIYQRLPYVSMGNKRAAAATWYLALGRRLREQAAG
jgi:DNA-binding NarL/FixJ family response regulator